MILDKYVGLAKDLASCIDANRLSLLWLIPANLCANLYFFVTRADNSPSVESLALASLSASIGATMGAFIMSLFCLGETYVAYKDTEELILEGIFDKEDIKNLQSWYSYRVGMGLACKKWGFEEMLREFYEEKA